MNEQTVKPPKVRARIWPRVLLGFFLLVLALLAAGFFALKKWLPSDEELARRLEAGLTQAVGVPVTVAAVHWTIFPDASITVEGLVTGQAAPIQIKKLSLHPQLRPLLRERELKFDLAEIDGAVVPQASVGLLGAKAPNPIAEKMWALSLNPILLDRLIFRQLTWISRTGVPMKFEGEMDFDEAWRPRQLLARLPEAKTPAELTLKRQGEQDAWKADIKVGGGTFNGDLRIDMAKGGDIRLAGKLQPRGVEIASMLQALNRRSVLSGKVSGQTTLSGSGANAAELVRALHSQTQFTVSGATVLRFDLDKAIRSLGREHDGQTRLDSLTGVLDTQNTAQGMAMNFSDIKAKSGVLSASGKAKLFNRRIDAELSVDLVDGLVGIPLKVSGPFTKVDVSMPGGAIAGAVLGTAVLPGVGTAIGARVGAALGNIFDGKPEASAKSKAPARPPASTTRPSATHDRP